MSPYKDTAGSALIVFLDLEDMKTFVSSGFRFIFHLTHHLASLSRPFCKYFCQFWLHQMWNARSFPGASSLGSAEGAHSTPRPQLVRTMTTNRARKIFNTSHKIFKLHHKTLFHHRIFKSRGVCWRDVTMPMAVFIG